jgi:hypothetical protein
MNDTPVQPATRASRGTASRLINLAGVILLIVAAALYWRDMQVNKEKAAAAGMVRLNATTPMIAMGLMLDSTGAAQNILIGCPRDIATNIISKLAQAEATDFPSGTVEGDEYKIYLMFTNRTMAVMRAVRLYDSPSNLYVGMQIPAEFDENKTPISWVYTRPAFVPDLGSLFKDMADRHVPELQKNAAQYQAGLTNLATRLAEVSTAADAATNATVEAWFNETNAPAAAPETPAPAPEVPAASLEASPPRLATPPEAAAAE